MFLNRDSSHVFNWNEVGVVQNSEYLLSPVCYLFAEDPRVNSDQT